MWKPTVSGHATIEHSQRQRIPVRLLNRLREIVRDGQAQLRGSSRATRRLPNAANRGGWQQTGHAARPKTRDRRRRFRVALL